MFEEESHETYENTLETATIWGRLTLATNNWDQSTVTVKGDVKRWMDGWVAIGVSTTEAPVLLRYGKVFSMSNTDYG